MSAPALRDIHTLFYRGYLKSCNYHCGYCPFHKHARNDKNGTKPRYGAWLTICLF